MAIPEVAQEVNKKTTAINGIGNILTQLLSHTWSINNNLPELADRSFLDYALSLDGGMVRMGVKLPFHPPLYPLPSMEGKFHNTLWLAVG
ncbi:MAG: hypothetical protein Fur0020_04550 [Thermodesulfovibrionia bacterium]